MTIRKLVSFGALGARRTRSSSSGAEARALSEAMVFLTGFREQVGLDIVMDITEQFVEMMAAAEAAVGEGS